MAEPTTAIAITKIIVSTLVAIKNSFLSMRFMVFWLIIGAIGAFVPLSFWEWANMTVVGNFFHANHELAVLIFGLALIVIIILYVSDILRKHKEESDLARTMETLTPVEMKALCNAYHNGGKYSLPSCYAEIESLKKKGLIVVSPESGSFGGQEFTLSDKTYAYIKEHSDFFAKRGIEPDPPEEDKVPFCAVV